MNLSRSPLAPLLFAGALACPIVQAAEEPLPAPSAVPAMRANVLPPQPTASAPTAPSVSSPSGLADAAAPKSQNATINLIHRLVQRGILTKEDSEDLIRQAETDAADAREQAEATQQAVSQASAAAQAVAAAQTAPNPEAGLATDPLAPMMGAAEDDAVRVPYIPETVRAQMRDEIKSEVLAQARDEHWAAPNALPEWVSRMRFSGDVRIRAQGDYFPDGNDKTGAFPNFNAINTGAPFDVSGNNFAPQLNVDEDRLRFRLRARFGVEADLADGFTAGVRIGTGETNSPVSENQSLGVANNGQGGNFSKYAIWLDRGFLKYEQSGEKWKASISLGRFDNPWFATSILWADDLAFDGLALQSKMEVAKGVTPFFTAGAFPVFNTDFNFSTNQPDKFKSEDKWLYAAQIGTDWKINQDFSAKLAAAYYHFDNIEGHLSSPYTPLSASDQGNTDDSRPSFAQKGNTYRPLRNIKADESNQFGTTNQFQYYGLASRFCELAFTGKLDYSHYEPFHVMLTGEYVKNLGFDRGAIEQYAVNNRGSGLGRFDGGNNAWITTLRVGSPTLEKRGNWNLGVSYRYVESDAVVDGFNDSDFGGGGTNLKGYTLSGAVALSPYFSLGLRWMSANEIAGPPLKNDTLQLDFNGKF